jgi:hypothetical protein
MAPTPDPRDAVMARAIEKTRGQVEQIIAEARERQCFVYKGHADVRSHIITLHFTSLIAGDQFSRTINCFPLFEAEGVEFELGDALTIMGEVDSLVLNSGEFQEYRVAKSIRGARESA